MGRTSTAREDLVSAASDLMWGRGFVDVGVSELCQAAGVRPGSFYHFFSSKDELGAAAIRSHLECTKETVLDPANAIEDPIERLTFYFEQIARTQEGIASETGQVKGCPFGNLAGEVSALDPAVRSALGDASAGMTDFFVRLAQDAVGQGQSAAGDAEARGRAVFAFVEGVLIMARMTNDPGVIRRMASQAVALLRS